MSRGLFNGLWVGVQLHISGVLVDRRLEPNQQEIATLVALDDFHPSGGPVPGVLMYRLTRSVALALLAFALFRV